MILVEQHQFNKGSKHYAELDRLCFLSKNLYNSSLYYVRQHYFKTSKYLPYSELNKHAHAWMHSDYTALPAKVAQQVQKLVDHNFKSFFEHLKVRKQGEVVNMPKYLPKQSGRQIVFYTDQAVSFKNRNVPQGYLRLSGTSFLIKTKVPSVEFARIVPHKSYVTVEIGYEQPELEPIKNTRYASIDLGVNNLAAVTSNVFKPFIINGRPLKSINQFYNKEIARLASLNGHWTSRMYRITQRRDNKMKNYMHKASKLIVNQLVSNNIGTLVIGKNDGWKQDTDMYKVNKQTFIQIPFNKFISMLTYKCQLQGISVVEQEESYTSKTSFINQDFIAVYGETDHLHKPSGYRPKRGLFKNKFTTISSLKSLNADINGSYNILRKHLTKQEAWNESIYSDCVEVCSTPAVIAVKA